MSDTFPTPPAGWRREDRPGVLAQAWAALGRGVDWLDGHGRKAWIIATVAGFFVAPPVGIALLLFSIGTGRMFSRRHRDSTEMTRSCGWGRNGMREGWEDRMRSARAAMRPSGNATFDAYKAETLRRLEDEQRAFEEFLGRLREAKDKAEFDQFMEDRARRASPVDGDRDDQAA